MSTSTITSSPRALVHCLLSSPLLVLDLVVVNHLILARLFYPPEAHVLVTIPPKQPPTSDDFVVIVMTGSVWRTVRKAFLGH